MKSLWLAEAKIEHEATTQLQGEVRADVCIVGGGFTGLWTALRLKELEPALDVVIVEADRCGSGASGRNGGFVLSWWAKFGTLLKLCGAQEGLRLARAAEKAVRELGDFCAAHRIDAHYRYDGWLWAATNPSQLGAWSQAMELAAKHGASPFCALSPSAAAELGGSDAHLGGVFEASAATVQPALLARGIRGIALSRGVTIYEHSPMRRLTRSRPARVETAQGAVIAETIVLALNAWSGFVPELRRSFVAVASDIAATRAAPEALQRIGWTDGRAISDSRMLVHYYRTTKDGRIAFGKAGGGFTPGNAIDGFYDGPAKRPAEVERQFRRLYPKLADIPIETTWTGPVCRSSTGLPFFGRVPGHASVFYGLGYSGNGVGPSQLGGRILASLALDVKDEWSGCPLAAGPPARFPPEPVRYIGAQAVRAALDRKERAEDAGRTVDPLTRAVASLAPTGLVPVKAS